jgi:hypothetical protein
MQFIETSPSAVARKSGYHDTDVKTESTYTYPTHAHVPNSYAHRDRERDRNETPTTRRFLSRHSVP